MNHHPHKHDDDSPILFRAILFSPYGNELWVMNGSEAIWSEYIFFNNDGTFSIA